MEALVVDFVAALDVDVGAGAELVAFVSEVASVVDDEEELKSDAKDEKMDVGAASAAAFSRDICCFRSSASAICFSISTYISVRRSVPAGSALYINSRTSR